MLQSTPSNAVDESVQRPDFDYHLHGEEWSVGQCGSRKRQSPIDFSAADTQSVSHGTLAYEYEPVTFPFKVQNNGHGIAADLSDNGIGGLTLDGSVFNLKTITIHARSEHTQAGAKFPLEVHLVHKRYDGDALAVVAFWVDSPQLPRVPFGGAPGSGDVPPDPRLAFFADHPPTEMNTTMADASEVNPLDFNAWFGQERFFSYEGSLTVPPCSEIVQWFVREKPVEAANAQVSSLFQSLFHMSFDIGNARAVMPRMSRDIRVLTAEKAMPVAEGGPPPDKGQYMEIPAPAFEGVAAGAEAMDAVRQNTARLADLDARIHAAAAAQPQALAGWMPPMTPDSGNGILTGLDGAGEPVPNIANAWRGRGGLDAAAA